MKAEQLVKGQPYLWVDKDGQSRPVKYIEKCAHPLTGEDGYKFRVSGYDNRYVILPKSEVERVVFRSSITPL